ncbi:unnamed protein product [Plutella xylostella]|uniref:(diamondback moth) hypothetical protein n=1 Tax=Plutella xylostella TaxID=51655 RepID=A0A8S4G427_PLUXY|nr:unnamed protein product [Plutella xylostella]
MQSCAVRVALPPRYNTRVVYTCEVSAEGPRFAVVKQTKNLTVAVALHQDPVIQGAPGSAQPGEQLQLNCSTAPAAPPASLLWYIDGQPEKVLDWLTMTESWLYHTEVSPPNEFGLRASWRTLRFRVPSANARSQVSLRCEATQPTRPPYSRASDATVVIDRSPHLSMFTASVWNNSAHAGKVDTALNETCRLVTGCLKPTPTDKLYLLAGIAPPAVRRQAAAAKERWKQLNDLRNPLYGHVPVQQRLKSRRSFVTTEPLTNETAQEFRLSRWRADTSHLRQFVQPAKELPAGGGEEWSVWKTLNRLRAGVARTKDNLRRWDMLPANASTLCRCGSLQTTSHLIECPNAPKCSQGDLMKANDLAIRVAKHWRKLA